MMLMYGTISSRVASSRNSVTGFGVSLIAIAGRDADLSGQSCANLHYQVIQGDGTLLVQGYKIVPHGFASSRMRSIIVPFVSTVALVSTAW